MESNFRSTVLQRPDDEDERDRHSHPMRDLMNPQSPPPPVASAAITPIAATPAPPAAAPHHFPGFNLRSPPKHDYTRSASHYSTTTGASNTPGGHSQHGLASTASPYPYSQTGGSRDAGRYSPLPAAQGSAPAVRRREGSAFYDPTSDSIAAEPRSRNSSTPAVASKVRGTCT